MSQSNQERRLRLSDRAAAFSSRRFANFKSSSSNGGGDPKKSISSRELACGCASSRVEPAATAALLPLCRAARAAAFAPLLQPTSTTTCCRKTSRGSSARIASSRMQGVDAMRRVVLPVRLPTGAADEAPESSDARSLLRGCSDVCCRKGGSRATEPSDERPMERNEGGEAAVTREFGANCDGSCCGFWRDVRLTKSMSDGAAAADLGSDTVISPASGEIRAESASCDAPRRPMLRLL